MAARRRQTISRARPRLLGRFATLWTSALVQRLYPPPPIMNEFTGAACNVFCEHALSPKMRLWSVFKVLFSGPGGRLPWVPGRCGATAAPRLTPAAARPNHNPSPKLTSQAAKMGRNSEKRTQKWHGGESNPGCLATGAAKSQTLSQAPLENLRRRPNAVYINTTNTTRGRVLIAGREAARWRRRERSTPGRAR